MDFSKLYIQGLMLYDLKSERRAAKSACSINNVSDVDTFSNLPHRIGSLASAPDTAKSKMGLGQVTHLG